VLRYGGDRDFPPFESVGENGQAQGLQIDSLRETAREGGFELVIELDDRRATERRFRAGELDAIAMVDIPSRRAWARFVRSHATPSIGVYWRSQQPDPQALPDLAGLRVASHDSPPLQDTRAVYLGNTGATFVETASPLASLEAVRDGAADLAVMPRAFGDRLLAGGAFAGVVAGSMNLRLQSYAFAVRPDDSARQQQLEAALERFEASGRLEALRVQWLSSHRVTAAQGRCSSGS
jgi:two-component system NtrC family sensor kinase